MPAVTPASIAPALWLLAAHRRIVPVPLQFVLAIIGGALLVAAILALWRAEQKCNAARKDPSTGWLIPEAFRLDAAARMDRRGPVSLVVIDGNGTDEIRLADLHQSLAPVLRSADVVGHLDDGRFAVLVPVGGAAARQVARRATEQGCRCGVGVAPSGAKTSLDALIEQALAGLDGVSAPDERSWPDPIEEPVPERGRPARDPISGTLTRSAFLAELEHLMYARKLPEGYEVVAVALDVPDTPGPDGVMPDPAPFVWMREAMDDVLRVEDRIGRVARNALAVAAVIRIGTAPAFAERMLDAFERKGRISGQWNSHSTGYVGFARCPHHAKTAVSLLSCALSALRQAVAG